jgi:hypothetical protein
MLLVFCGLRGRILLFSLIRNPLKNQSLLQLRWPCTAAAPSLVEPGTEHVVSSGSPMLLKLSKPLASGSPVCVRETFSGANAPAAATFNAVVLAASARVQTQPATLSIEPAADGDARLMIDPLAPAQGLSATVHV